MIDNKSSTLDKHVIPQTITINNRSNIIITAVKKLISIKDDLAQVDTHYGVIMVSGKNLAMQSLDTDKGQLSLSGEIDSIRFSNTKTKENILKKIWK